MHSQFHHQVQGADGITYGCYGHINPYGNLSATFYISDRWGYRVVHPEESVKLFDYKVKQSYESHNHQDFGQVQQYHSNGILTSWKDLHFPPSCGRYEGIHTMTFFFIIFCVISIKNSSLSIISKH